LHIEHHDAGTDVAMDEVITDEAAAATAMMDAVGDAGTDAAMGEVMDELTDAGRALSAHLGAYETESNWILVEGPNDEGTHWEVTNYLQLSEEEIIEYLAGGGVWGGPSDGGASDAPANEGVSDGGSEGEAAEAPSRKLMEHGITVGKIQIAEEFTAAKAKAEDLDLPVATISYADIGTVDENKIAEGSSSPATTEASGGEGTAAPETTPGTTTAAKSFSKAKAITGTILALLGLAQF